MKKGVPDVVAAARSVLNDWNSGKIKYCTQPPEEEQRNDIHLSAAIVHSDAREFDVDNFEAMETEILNKFDVKSDEVMQIISSGPVEMAINDTDLKQTGKVIINENLTAGKKRKLKETSEESKVDPVMNLEGKTNMKIKSF